MHHRTQPESVVSVVHAGERLRVMLREDLSRAATVAEQAAVVTETAMFYCQAFRNVYDAALKQPSPETVTDLLMTECVFGLSVYREWLTSELSLLVSHDSALDLQERMAGHWLAITRLVLEAGQ